MSTDLWNMSHKLTSAAPCFRRGGASHILTQFTMRRSCSGPNHNNNNNNNHNEAMCQFHLLLCLLCILSNFGK